MRCRRSTCPLLWLVYGAVRWWVTLREDNNVVVAPENSRPLSVRIVDGTPKGAMMCSRMAVAIVEEVRSGISFSTQNLLKQQMAANKWYLGVEGGPKLVTRSILHSKRGPAGRGISWPYQEPCVRPALSWHSKQEEV